MFAQEFVRNALIAGSAVAIASGAVGYFVVLRAQAFAGDALSHVAFTGTLAAALAGIDLRVGLFAATIGIALSFSGVGSRFEADDTAIGVIFTWVLGLGVLFLYLFNRGAGGADGALAARTLFGSIFSLDSGQTAVAALVGAGVLAGVAAIGRPLLFATVAPQSAASRGVPVGLVGAGFLSLLGADAAEATQAVGALLLLGLLVAPAGAALLLTASPVKGLLLSGLFGLGSVWLGVVLAYEVPSLPPGSAIVGVAVAVYTGALAVARRPRYRQSPQEP